MRKIKHLSMTAVLIFMLSASALAGDIHIDKAPPPPPPGSSSLVAPTNLASLSDAQIVASTSVTDVMLQVLQSMLSVF